MEMDAINFVLWNLFVEMELPKMEKAVMMVIQLVVMVVVLHVQFKKAQFAKEQSVLLLKTFVEMEFSSHRLENNVMMETKLMETDAQRHA